MFPRIAVVMLVLVGLALVGVSLSPAPYQEITLRVKGVLPGAVNERMVSLHLPQELPAGEAVLLQMDVPAVELSSSDALFLEGRLELPGVTVFPGDVVLAPDRSAQPVSFRWLVTAAQAPVLSGTLWLTEIFKAPDNGERRDVLLARPLEFEWRTLLGLSLPEARWLGGGLALTGIAVFMFKRMWKVNGRKNK